MRGDCLSRSEPHRDVQVMTVGSAKPYGEVFRVSGRADRLEPHRDNGQRLGGGWIASVTLLVGGHCGTQLNA